MKLCFLVDVTVNTLVQLAAVMDCDICGS